MPKVVSRDPGTGQLIEVLIPELLIVRRQGGSWLTQKPAATFMTHNAPSRQVTFNVDGWFTIDAKDPEFFFAGQTFNCRGGTTWFYGPLE